MNPGSLVLSEGSTLGTREQIGLFNMLSSSEMRLSKYGIKIELQ